MNKGAWTCILHKHTVSNKCTITQREWPKADWCLLFVKQPWEVSEASPVRYLDSPTVCVWVLHFIKHIPVTLSSSKWNNSLFLDLVCSESSRARAFSWPFAWEAEIWLRKPDNRFHQAIRLEVHLVQRVRDWRGTLPEWVHFLHNPP